MGVPVCHVDNQEDLCTWFEWECDSHTLPWQEGWGSGEVLSENSLKCYFLSGGKADVSGHREPCQVPSRGLILHTSLSAQPLSNFPG